MTSVLPPLAVVFAAALVLAGCAGAAPSAPAPGTDPDVPTSDATPATGELISGDGYTYNVPDGWGVPPETPSGFDPDTLAVDLADTDGFTDNINVLLSPAGTITSDQVESLGVDELEGAGATGVEVRPRVGIAGEESAHLTALFTQGGVSYQIDQYYPTHDGQTYVVTFSFSETETEAEREDLAESVLASWAWE
ncbi:hypothetical protein [Pseudolysinimonas sp.]|jgi:hypothetical protein|uniref:hypothetical protein n=1 Tax=Pseudolysinimonas sp. TaxID=2680009 RepID=UPI0037850F70